MRDGICGIYKITNKINNKVYIGASKNIKYRWTKHKFDYKNKKVKKLLLHEDMYKYGIENFEFEIICECKKEELYDLEIKYIEKYNTYIYSENSNGYNRTKGGKGGYGNKNSLGTQHTEETKKKISEVNKGHKVNRKSIEQLADEHSKKVFCIETNKIYNSMTEASNITGCNRRSIGYACNGERKNGCKSKKDGKWYHWIYYDEENYTTIHKSI